jgi:hypothetical protein
METAMPARRSSKKNCTSTVAATFSAHGGA